MFVASVGTLLRGLSRHCDARKPIFCLTEKVRNPTAVFANTPACDFHLPLPLGPTKFLTTHNRLIKKVKGTHILTRVMKER
jgi:hypothetical protein